VAWRKQVRVYVGSTDRNLPIGRLKAKGYLKRTVALGTPADAAEASRKWSLSAKSPRFVTQLLPYRWFHWNLITSSLRDHVDHVLTSFDDARPGVVLVRALLLGDLSLVPKQWLRGMRRAGLVHLLAVSGLHAGILAGLVLVLTFRLPLPVRAVLVGLVIVCYFSLTGPRPGMVRSTGMAALASVALWFHRPPQAKNILATMAVLLAVQRPELVFDLGFRLTMSATAGIVFLSPCFLCRWTALPQLVRTPLAVGVGAQLGSMAWLVPYANVITPLAPALNLVAVPWTAVALVGAYTWTCLAVTWPQLAGKLLGVMDLLSLPFAWQGTLGPHLIAAIPVNLTFGRAALLTVLLTLVLLASRAKLFAASALVIWLCLQWRPIEEGVRLTMLDVGQGESLIIQDGGVALLVDGGGLGRVDLASRVLLPALSTRGIHRLSGVVLTHSDFDHCGGLSDIASYLVIEEVWVAPGSVSSPCAQELLSKSWLRLRVAWEGSRIKVGRWLLTALHPSPGSRARGNDKSLVFLAEAFDRKLLLTADLEARGEKELIARLGVQGLKADVLKVAHHGSNSSTSPWFLNAVNPRLAIISAGPQNRYGHPAGKVLDRLQVRGIPVLRTDQLGNIDLVVVPDGRLQIHTSPD
jgi:competence protein ComEC